MPVTQTKFRTGQVRAAANTVTGNQDFTDSSLGGMTPKAAMFFVTQATSSTPVAGAAMSVGACDDTREWMFTATAEDNVGTTDTSAGARTDAVIELLDEGEATVDCRANFVSFIANGVRINWSNAPSAAYLVHVVFYAGSDLTVRADSFTGPNTSSTTDVTTVGFEPDMVIIGCAYKMLAPEEDGNQDAALALGVGVNSPTIANMGYGWAANNGSSSELSRIRRDTSNAIVCTDPSAANTMSAVGLINDYDANGFSFVADATGPFNDTTMCYLAIKADVHATPWVDSIDYPTSTGTQANPDSGLVSEHVMVVGGPSPAQTGSNTTDAGFFAVGFAKDASNEWACGVAEDYGADTTDNESFTFGDRSFYADLLNDADSTAVGAFVSHDEVGFTVNFTTAPASLTFGGIAFGFRRVVEADVYIGVAAINIPGGVAGDVDYDLTDSTNLGGKTPKAVLFYAVDTDAVTVDTVDPWARASFGAADGTREWAVGAMSQDGAANTNTVHVQSASNVYWLPVDGAESNGIKGRFNSFITNGVRVTREAGSVDSFLIAVMFAGDDVEAYVDQYAPHASASGTVTITAPGFQPQFVMQAIAKGTGSWGTGTHTADFHLTWAMAAHNPRATPDDEYDGWGMWVGERDDRSSGDPYMRVWNSPVVGECNFVAAVSPVWGTFIDSTNANGFTATNLSDGAPPTSQQIGYFALRFNGDFEASDWEFQTTAIPSATGNQTYDAITRMRLFLFGIAALDFDGTGDDEDRSTKAGRCFGAGACLKAAGSDAFTDAAGCIMIDDNAATTDTASAGGTDAAIVLYEDNQSDKEEATLNSTALRSWVLNWSDVTTNADGNLGAITVSHWEIPAAVGAVKDIIGLGIVPFSRA